jgi:hypothetical protein
VYCVTGEDQESMQSGEGLKISWDEASTTTLKQEVG